MFSTSSQRNRYTFPMLTWYDCGMCFHVKERKKIVFKLGKFSENKEKMPYLSRIGSKPNCALSLGFILCMHNLCSKMMSLPCTVRLMHLTAHTVP